MSPVWRVDSNVDVAPAATRPEAVMLPPEVRRIFPAALPLLLELTTVPASKVAGPPLLMVMVPPFPVAEPRAAPEITAPARLDAGPCRETLPPAVMVMSPPLPVPRRASAYRAL